MNSTGLVEVDKIYDCVCLKDNSAETTKIRNGSITYIKIFLDPMRQKCLHIHYGSRYQSVFKQRTPSNHMAKLLLIKNVRVVNKDDLELVEMGDDQVYEFAETESWISDPSKVLLEPLVEGPPTTFSFDDEPDVLENVRSMQEAWKFEERRKDISIPARALRLSNLSTWFRRFHRNDIVLPPFIGSLCEDSLPLHLMSDDLQNGLETIDLSDDSDCDSVSGNKYLLNMITKIKI